MGKKTNKGTTELLYVHVGVGEGMGKGPFPRSLCFIAWHWAQQWPKITNTLNQLYAALKWPLSPYPSCSSAILILTLCFTGQRGQHWGPSGKARWSSWRPAFKPLFFCYFFFFWGGEAHNWEGGRLEEGERDTRGEAGLYCLTVGSLCRREPQVCPEFFFSRISCFITSWHQHRAHPAARVHCDNQ